MKGLIWFVLALGSSPAWAEDIVEVLDRSQRQRLESLPLADAAGERANKVRSSFERVVQAADFRESVELRIITGAITAETLRGRVIVANESLAELSEGERCFILAHELGHVAMHHWKQVGVLYKKYIPAAVTKEVTDPVAAPLGRDASGQSHGHELDADAFSVRLLARMGHSDEAAYSAFKRMGLTRDTPTHPGTRKRMAALRELAGAPVRTAVLVTAE